MACAETLGPGSVVRVVTAGDEEVVATACVVGGAVGFTKTVVPGTPVVVAEVV